MGVRVHYVGRKQRFRSLEQNINATSSSYPIHNVFFGTKGSSYGVREIHSRNHEKTAKDFFNKIARGGILDLHTINGGVISRMKDGTVISYRKITSSSNSPAVEIRFRKLDSKYGIKDQKIHFVQDK
jgi:hypothetical protein